MRQSPRRRPDLGRILSYGILGLWALVCLFPLYWVAATSLKGPFQIINGPYYVPLIDFMPSLAAWRYVLFDVSDAPLLRYLNTVIVAAASTTLTVPLGALAVYGLTRFQHRISWMGLALMLIAMAFASAAIFTQQAGIQLCFATIASLALLIASRSNRRRAALVGNTGIRIAILATRILPPVVIVLPIYLMAQYTGTLDTRLALVATYTATNLPVAVWLLHPVFGDAARDVEDAAQLDGASHFRIFREIAVPLAARGLAATGLLIFIMCWNEYLFSVYLATDHAMTMPSFLAGQMSVREQQAAADAEEWARLSGVIVLMTAPLILGTGLAQRFIARSSFWHE